MRVPRPIIRAVGRVHAGIYRASGGRLLATVRGMPMLLLTTTGRRTGKARTVPLLYVRDAAAYAITGSQGGHDADPAWVGNLRAEPVATIQVGEWTHLVSAAEADPETHDRLWPMFVATFAGYADYRARTDRPFAIFLLAPQIAP